MKAEFLLSTLDEVPLFKDKNGKVMPEIAFVGRSNVGKSSLINHLLNRKKLAKVSAKPGKTQTINYFNVDDRLILVDLPGYGYAARGHEMQLKWSAAIDHYLENRSSLVLLVLLIDSRRTPSDEDLALMEWSKHHKKPLLLIFTKSDTLEKKNKVTNGLLYSIKDSNSRAVLIKTLNKFIDGSFK